MNVPPLDHDEHLEAADRIAYLIAGHIGGTLTDAEKEELDDWIVDSDENLELFERLTDEDNIAMGLQKHIKIDKNKAAVLEEIKETIGLKRKTRLQKAWPYMVAASIVLIAISLFLFRNNQESTHNEKPTQLAKTIDVLPGSHKAVLTLSDGRTIILDSTGSGLMANEGSVKIQKVANGEILYTGTDEAMRYNSVSTPRGGQYKLILSDGTKVWLNAESSLKFPAGFAGESREVELKGEAYFEVTKNNRAFGVTIISPSGEGGRVEVLGTQFNVNGYADEGGIKATLVEGSVKLVKGAQNALLRPGQKAIIGEAIKVMQADVVEETAWKNGKFLFRDAAIKSVGEQLKRWYDIDVAYEGTVVQHFNLEVSRDVPLARLLELLSATEQVHFELTGKKLVIKP